MKDLSKYLERLAVKMSFFNLPHYKSMETLSCHSKQTKELNLIKNIQPVKCNMVNISIESQPQRAYGF